jgi:hypothetical protein
MTVIPFSHIPESAEVLTLSEVIEERFDPEMVAIFLEEGGCVGPPVTEAQLSDLFSTPPPQPEPKFVVMKRKTTWL